MDRFSSNPFTTKYRQDTQETSILPKAPLFPQPVCLLFHDHWLFIYFTPDDSYTTTPFIPSNKQWRSSGPLKHCISEFSSVKFSQLAVHFWVCLHFIIYFLLMHVLKRICVRINSFSLPFPKVIFKAKEAWVRLFLSWMQRAVCCFCQVMNIWHDNFLSWHAKACQKLHDHKRSDFLFVALTSCSPCASQIWKWSGTYMWMHPKVR